MNESIFDFRFPIADYRLPISSHASRPSTDTSDPPPGGAGFIPAKTPPPKHKLRLPLHLTARLRMAGIKPAPPPDAAPPPAARQFPAARWGGVYPRQNTAAQPQAPSSPTRYSSPPDGGHKARPTTGRRPTTGSPLHHRTPPPPPNQRAILRPRLPPTAHRPPLRPIRTPHFTFRNP